MHRPTCHICGKTSIRDPCASCYRKDYNKIYGYKPNFRVRCIICNKRTTSTNIKYLTEDYKCKRCR